MGVCRPVSNANISLLRSEESLPPFFYKHCTPTECQIENLEFSISNFQFSVSGHREGLRTNHCAGSYSLGAFHNHAFTRFQSLVDYPHRLDAIAGLDWPNADFVVGIDDRDLIGALQFCDRSLWNEQRPGLSTSHCAHLSVLPRTKNVSRVRKNSRESNRAGLFIHFSVRDEELPFLRIGCSVRKNQLQFEFFVRRVQLSLRRVVFSQGEILLLAESEVDLNRIDRRNGCQRSAVWVVRLYQIPHLRLGYSRDAIDGRSDLCEPKIQSGSLRRSLGRFDRSFCRRYRSSRGLHSGPCRLHLGLRGEIRLNRIVVLLFADHAVLHQGGVAVLVELSLPLVRFGLRKPGLRL